MSLSSVYSAAVSGLNGAETMIDTTGNNVANANTVGFKSSSVEFATQFVQTLGLGSAPSTTNGGTNPQQTGLGVEVASISQDFSQGTLQTTSNPLDLAIQGQGFFAVQSSSGQTLYTRDGQLQLNADHQVTTSSGGLLLGYGVDSNFNIQSSGSLQTLTIPLGTSEVAKATSNVNMEGTLSASGTPATTSQIQESQVFGDSTVAAPILNTATNDTTVAQQADVPSEPTAALGSGGTLPDGTYNYVAVFADGNSAGTASPPSTAISFATGTNGGNNSINLSGIPTDANYAETEIYREGSDGKYHFLTTIDNTAKTTATTGTYTDSTLDASLLTQPTLSSNTLTGEYEYYVTYTPSANGPGNAAETRPSPLIGPINVAGGAIQLANLPTPPAGDSINIYRANVSSTTDTSFHYIGNVTNADIANNGGVPPNFTDSVSDATADTNPTIDMNGPVATANTKLVSLLTLNSSGTGSTPVFSSGGTLTFTGEVGSSTLTAQTLTINSGTTVTDLTNFIQGALGIQGGNGIPNDVTGATPSVKMNGNGQIVVVSNTGVDNAATIPLGSFTLTSGTTSTPLGLTFNTTQTAIGTGAQASVVVYDSLGTAINVNITAELQSSSASGTVYRWYANTPANQPPSGSPLTTAVGSGTITFDGQGNYVSSTGASIAIDRTDTAAVSPLDVNLDFSKLSGLATTTSTLQASGQDGFAAGTLTSYNIGDDGTIQGVFSNGTQRNVGQIALTLFYNDDGLEQQGQNMFATGVNSGLPITTTPNAGGAGSIVSGALEQSNTDIGQSLITLTTASSMYQSNAQVIQTVNTLLQDLLTVERNSG